MTALETRGLKKAFGSLVVSDDVSLSVPVGARHALIGPNGAGKTTLINLVTGALKPDSGSVHLMGAEVTRDEMHRRVRKGLSRTFQINTLFPKLTPIEAVTLAVCERDRHSRRFLRPLSANAAEIDEAAALLDTVGLGDVATRTTQDLAYGQQRLLEIALALASRPKVLLLDEPAAGVPRTESGELFRVISELPEDISVLFIEHDMTLVFRFASRITVLVSGAVLTEGTPDEISADPRVREVYLGSAHG